MSGAATVVAAPDVKIDRGNANNMLTDTVETLDVQKESKFTIWTLMWTGLWTGVVVCGFAMWLR